MAPTTKKDTMYNYPGRIWLLRCQRAFKIENNQDREEIYQVSRWWLF